MTTQDGDVVVDSNIVFVKLNDDDNARNDVVDMRKNCFIARVVTDDIGNTFAGAVVNSIIGGLLLRSKTLDPLGHARSPIVYLVATLCRK